MRSRVRKIASYIVSQVLAVLYALALTFLPGDLYWIVITLFFISYMAIMVAINVRRMRISATSPDAQFVSSGRQIVRMDSKKALEIMQNDTDLNYELREQAKVMLMPMLSLPIVFAIYYIYTAHVTPLYITHDDALIRFLGNLVMFEIFFLIPMAINKLMRKGKPTVFVQPVMNYLITDRGIQGAGILIKFPIEDHSIDIRCNKSRKFLELVREQNNPMSGRMIMIQRLYMDSKELEKAIDALKKYGKIDIKCT
ncbi:MAG: DUF2208 family protein [Sulfolobales archaeon]